MNSRRVCAGVVGCNFYKLARRGFIKKLAFEGSEEKLAIQLL